MAVVYLIEIADRFFVIDYDGNVFLVDQVQRLFVAVP